MRGDIRGKTAVPDDPNNISSIPVAEQRSGVVSGHGRKERRSLTQCYLIIIRLCDVDEVHLNLTSVPIENYSFCLHIIFLEHVEQVHCIIIESNAFQRVHHRKSVGNSSYQRLERKVHMGRWYCIIHLVPITVTEKTRMVHINIMYCLILKHGRIDRTLLQNI